MLDNVSHLRESHNLTVMETRAAPSAKNSFPNSLPPKRLTLQKQKDETNDPHIKTKNLNLGTMAGPSGAMTPTGYHETLISGEPMAFFPHPASATQMAAAASLMEFSEAPGASQARKQEGDKDTIKKLFCMMIQMQTNMKGIQENVCDLQSRVTLLEGEHGFDSRLILQTASKGQTNSNSQAKSNAALSHFKVEKSHDASHDGTVGQVERNHDTVSSAISKAISNFEDFKSNSKVKGPMTYKLEGQITDADLDEQKQFVLHRNHFDAHSGPRQMLDLDQLQSVHNFVEATPIREKTQSPSPQIPFISRRTLWKKANKPKWKRRVDLVPRLKEIVNEKFKADEADKFRATLDCGQDTNSGSQGDVTPLNGEHDMSYHDMQDSPSQLQDNSGTSASKPMDDCLDLSTENLMTALAVFPGPGLPTPPRLAPIWRAPDVVPEPHLTKPATSGVKNGVAMGTLTGNEAAPTDNRPSELEAAHSEPNAKPEFMCTICFKILASKSSLDTHTKSIHENRKFPCTDCGKRFFDRSTLRRHKKCIHENITHRCKFCSLEFSRRHYLTSHVHKEHPNILQTNEQPGSNSVNLSLGGITGQVSPENCHKTKDNQKKETRSPGPEVSRHIIPGENHDHRKPSKREGNSLRNGISDLA